MLKNHKGNKKKLIYLASPYTVKGNVRNIDFHLLDDRFHEVTKCLARLTEQHYKSLLFFGPITHSHHVASYMNPELHTAQVWLDETDDYWVELADELWICAMRHWNESSGVQHEIELATAKDKPIRYIDPITGYFITREEALRLG